MATQSLLDANDASSDPLPPRRAVVGWILYDLANTIFSINIVSNYFSLWVIQDQRAADSTFYLADAISMACLLITAPLLGAISDQLPRRLPLLMASTFVCCALTAALGSGGLWGSLVLFAMANYVYSAGLIFYDSLLPTVSTETNRGRIGGLGVGIGYVGSIIGIATGMTVQALGGSKPTIFRLTALLFLLFALPCFFWVRERPRPIAAMNRTTLEHSFSELRASLRGLAALPDLKRFLIGRVFYADAANTLILIMGIYAVEEVGFTATEKDRLLLVGIVAAITGGLVLGRQVDRSGPRRTLYLVLGVWTVTLALTAAIGFFDLPRELFWFVAPLAGIALGGTWTADRPFLLRLAPPHQIGQYYGLYAMAGRFSAVLGPLLLALIVDGLGWGRPAGVASLLVMIGLSALVLRPVSDARRYWSIA